MPGLRDLLNDLAAREEVTAVLVVGGDGLLIDSAGRDRIDAEAAAAVAPGLVAQARELGSAAGREGAGCVVVEHGNGVSIVTQVSPDVLMIAFVKADAPFGRLLHELRHDRERIASLV
ncbi:MAG: roadblock/LC7 domain-containing protein [Gemmatimonadetes bacterium]|nr:roadblock/LC7 domain-containing protein [Gemmatimonadota bacterium]